MYFYVFLKDYQKNNFFVNEKKLYLRVFLDEYWRKSFCCQWKRFAISRFLRKKINFAFRVTVEKGNGKTISSLPISEKGNSKKSLLFPHAKREIPQKNFPFLMGKGKLKKKIFSRDARCEIPHPFPSLRNHPVRIFVY